MIIVFANEIFKSEHLKGDENLELGFGNKETWILKSSKFKTEVLGVEDYNFGCCKLQF